MIGSSCGTPSCFFRYFYTLFWSWDLILDLGYPPSSESSFLSLDFDLFDFSLDFVSRPRYWGVVIPSRADCLSSKLAVCYSEPFEASIIYLASLDSLVFIFFFLSYTTLVLTCLEVSISFYECSPDCIPWVIPSTWFLGIWISSTSVLPRFICDDLFCSWRSKKVCSFFSASPLRSVGSNSWVIFILPLFKFSY